MTETISSSYIWDELKKYASPHNDFYTPVLSTIDNDNPSSRMVVLREISIAHRMLSFYSDKRSAKINQISQNSNVQFLFYHREKQYQLSMSGKAQLSDDQERHKRIWDVLKRKGAYQTIHAPGTIISSPLSHLLDSEDPMNGFENFIIVDCLIDKMELYQLDKDHNKRVRFSYFEDQWVTSWLVP